MTDGPSVKHADDHSLNSKGLFYVPIPQRILCMSLRFTCLFSAWRLNNQVSYEGGGENVNYGANFLDQQIHKLQLMLKDFVDIEESGQEGMKSRRFGTKAANHGEVYERTVK